MECWALITKIMSKIIVLGLFLLFIGSPSYAGIVTAEHQVLRAKNSYSGTSQLELAITLTNHGGKDIEHAHFQFQDSAQLDLFSRLTPLLVERIPSGARITVRWKIDGPGSAEQWQQGRSFSLSGQGVVDSDTLVPLKVFSEAIVSLD